MISLERKTEKLSLINYYNCRQYGLNVDNYEFSMLLKKVNTSNILSLFQALLLEKKVIIISKNTEKLAIIIEALVSLLKPIKWSFVNISYVTSDFLESLESPFPYIIGVSKDIWEHHF